MPRLKKFVFVMTTSFVLAILLLGILGDQIVMSASKNTIRPKRETLNIRIKPEERNLIDRAASMRGKNRTDFILDAARVAAEEALLDRVVVIVNPKAYTEFLARLDMPPQPNKLLRKTMQTLAPWDEAWEEE